MKKRKSFFIFLLILMFLLFSSCQKENIDLENKKNENEVLNIKDEKPKGFLYKIVNENNNSTVNLLGSIHVFKKEWYPLSDEIMQAYDNAKSVSFEILSPSSDELLKSTNVMILPDKKTIYDILDKKTSEMLKKVLKDKNIDEQLVINFLPIFASTNLQTYLLQKLGYNSDDGIDVFFENLAKKDGKNVYAIEGMYNQINHLSKISMDTQIIVLKETLTSLLEKNDEESNNLMFDCYKNADVKKMLKYSEQGTIVDNAEFRDNILISRNKIMADYIENLLKEKDSNNMVVVGAFHVIGNDGILQILYDKGYKVVSYY